MKNLVKNLPIITVATDPIYIGTGGYTIGRVDNTIVRDPITKIPKIPGTSLAGTWRYYMALHLQRLFKDEYISTRKKRANVKEIKELFSCNTMDSKNAHEQGTENWIFYEGNKYSAIKCAGQDELPQVEYSDSHTKDKGHCGRCIVCKGFGFSKKDISWQGMLLFSDLNILLFPVYTRYGVKWITSEKIMKEAGLLEEETDKINEKNTNREERRPDIIVFSEKASDKKENWLNLGWINLPYQVKKIALNLDVIENLTKISSKDICMVPDSLISQIINSNLEVRTSVSIDPLTGAAKEGALFTSEAMPRATVFYGNIRIFDKSMFNALDAITHELPSAQQLECALKDTGCYFETLGIGGMTTRGFGRFKIHINP